MSLLTAIMEGLSSFGEASPGLALVGAALWGLSSVALSPCHLSAVPLAVGTLGRRGDTSPWVLSSALTLGVVLSLMLVGSVTVALGRIAGDLWGLGSWVTAGVLALGGLALLDALPTLPGVALDAGRLPGGLFGAALAGAILGIGLGPCTFAFLTPVIGLSVQASEPFAAGLFGAFAVGHAVASVVVGVLGSALFTTLRGAGRIASTLRVTAGVGLLLWALRVVGTAP